MRVARTLAVAILMAAFANAVGAAPGGSAAGTYVTTRPSANGTQELVLLLDPRGGATLTTGFPELVRRYGSGVLPVREVGTWRGRDKTVVLRLTTIGLLGRVGITKAKRENKLLVLSIMGCRLSAVQYPKELYGEAGLTLEKSGCIE